MNIEDTLAPDSDQLDAIDLLGGPRRFTVTKVSRGKDDQPVNIHLAEFPRVWRPGKSMRRVLASCWGNETDAWVGRQVELYCDDTIRFGNDVVGGTRIARLSHIDKVKKIPLLVSRGKSATFTVQPLPELTTAEKIDAYKAEWHGADPERRKVIEDEVAKLQGKKADPPADPGAIETPEPEPSDAA